MQRWLTALAPDITSARTYARSEHSVRLICTFRIRLRCRFVFETSNETCPQPSIPLDKGLLILPLQKSSQLRGDVYLIRMRVSPPASASPRAACDTQVFRKTLGEFSAPIYRRFIATISVMHFVRFVPRISTFEISISIASTDPLDAGGRASEQRRPCSFGCAADDSRSRFAGTVAIKLKLNKD